MNYLVLTLIILVAGCSKEPEPPTVREMIAERDFWKRVNRMHLTACSWALKAEGTVLENEVNGMVDRLASAIRTKNKVAAIKAAKDLSNLAKEFQ